MCANIIGPTQLLSSFTYSFIFLKSFKHPLPHFLLHLHKSLLQIFPTKKKNSFSIIQFWDLSLYPRFLEWNFPCLVLLFFIFIMFNIPSSLSEICLTHFRLAISTADPWPFSWISCHKNLFLLFFIPLKSPTLLRKLYKEQFINLPLRR